MDRREEPERGFEAFGGLDVLETRVLLAGDHASWPQFAQATEIAMLDNTFTRVSVGHIEGTIGALGDDDLFRFTAPYTARAAVIVTQTTLGGLAPAVRVYDQDELPYSGLIDGARGQAATQPISFPYLVAGLTYYIDARAGVRSDTLEADLTGGYVIGIVMEIPPDQAHEPFPPGHPPMPIAISPLTGMGKQCGFLTACTDSSEFYFDAPAAGEVQVHVTTPGSDLVPLFSARDSAGHVTEASIGELGTASAVFVAPAAGERYWVHVWTNAQPGDPQEWGAFFITATVMLPGGTPLPPEATRPSDAQFAHAAPLGIDLRTGEGQADDAIVVEGGSDVFRFRALTSSMVSVAIERPPNGMPAASVTVFAGTTTQVAFSAVPAPGWLANVSFVATPGTEYFVWVRPSDFALGDYRLRVLSPPGEYTLYYPEGYSTTTIDEYVPLVNPNPFPVSYSITARYEVGERDQLIASGTLAASSRGGITVTTRRAPGASLVRVDTPYALEIRSSAQIGATLSHYDFGVTTGENFTSRLSTVWTFAEAHRDAAVYRDFLVFYNPNVSPTGVRITLVYDDGHEESFVRTVDALRRSGINLTSDTSVTHDGVFSVRIDSEQPIVAALTSYDISGQRGYGLLGDADGGVIAGAVPILAGVAGARPTLAIYNSSTTAATVDTSLTMVTESPLQVTRRFVIPAGGRATLSSADLGLDRDALAALRFTSDVPVTLASSEYHDGDGDATQAGTQATPTSLIADAFINPALAGTLYRETLSIHNPSAASAHVVISFLQPTGLLDTVSLDVPGRGFGFLFVDQVAAIRNLPDPVAFSIRIDGSSPVVTAFMHYDLFLNGGWATLGAPLGMGLSVARLG